jgi:hypothetical protein
MRLRPRPNSCVANYTSVAFPLPAQFGAAAGRADLSAPENLADMVACLLALPNNATIAELLVNMRYEDTLGPG